MNNNINKIFDIKDSLYAFLMNKSGQIYQKYFHESK